MTKRSNRKFKTCSKFKQDLWGHLSVQNKKIKALGKPHITNNNLSEYGTRLQAKQKIKSYYCNITEKQFKNIYKKSLKYPGKSYENLLILLERRLDTVIYRMNFAPTFYSSRQLISHGHVLVNNKKVDVHSYTVRNGDLIQIKPSSISSIYSNLKLNTLNSNLGFLKPVPSHIEVNYKLLAGILVNTPVINEIAYNSNMEVKKALEFYKG